jgi:hypothetical protein
MLVRLGERTKNNFRMPVVIDMTRAIHLFRDSVAFATGNPSMGF